jgi:hypothetical protein
MHDTYIYRYLYMYTCLYNKCATSMRTRYMVMNTPINMYIWKFTLLYIQRIAASKVIKRFIMHAKKTAFVVEHDFIMATYLADRVIVYDGQPGVEAFARAPQSLIPGMNSFLKQLNITFRRDPTNFRLDDMHININLYIDTYIYVCICMYMYVYIYIYIYICIYILYVHLIDYYFSFYYISFAPFHF